MYYGYIRVSSDKQTTANQEFEIKTFSKNNGTPINKWIKETISSTQELEKRQLGALLKKLKKGDVIITSEISRLGRNLLQIMSILHHCMKVGAEVWTIKDNYRLGSDIQSKVLAFAFGLSAEIERNLISQRTKEALLRLKAEGKVLGHPKGIRNQKIKLMGKEIEVKEMLTNNISQADIAKFFNVSRPTVVRFIERGFA